MKSSSHLYAAGQKALQSQDTSVYCELDLAKKRGLLGRVLQAKVHRAHHRGEPEADGRVPGGLRAPRGLQRHHTGQAGHPARGAEEARAPVQVRDLRLGWPSGTLEEAIFQLL